jgi:CheY-like chemotaxis protein
MDLTQHKDCEKPAVWHLILDRESNWTAWRFRYTGSPATAKMNEDRTRDSYPGKSLRILIVEDHGDTLEALSRLLTHFGHEISVADDAQSARKIIASKEFDVVLCDIALPDGSGYDVIAEVKRKRPVKAVALTGFGAPHDIERGKEAGFDFHLTKPVDFHELRAVLGQIAA